MEKAMQGFSLRVVFGVSLKMSSPFKAIFITSKPEL